MLKYSGIKIKQHKNTYFDNKGKMYNIYKKSNSNSGTYCIQQAFHDLQFCIHIINYRLKICIKKSLMPVLDIFSPLAIIP